jgi:serine/threonine protein kinase
MKRFRITLLEWMERKNLQPPVELPRMSEESVAGGRYRLERQLGHGGMATVFLARDTELDRAVAVKCLAENVAGQPELRDRFVREARLAARLSHPGVVSVFDAGEDDGRPYIVMEHVEGETLADLLAQRGRLPVEEARQLTLQASRGLAHAHAAGLVHRDIKPQNLLLRNDGTLKIADFGIARAVEGTSLTQAGTILGTAAYLSPEQALGEQVTAAADVYSLGAVLYELLTGRTPLEAESLADLAEQQRRPSIAPVRELAPEVPVELEDVVMRCLARNPDYRPSSSELERELAPAATEQPTAQPTPPPAPLLAGRRALWLGLAGLVALAAILLAVTLVGSPSHKATPPSRPRAVPSIPRGADAQEQARNIAAWIRRYSASR